MSTREWLDARRREVTPSAADEARVQGALDAVQSTLVLDGSIAEIHPAGSAAKRTMLRGRNEGDLVLVMREAPTQATLDQFAQRLEEVPGVIRVEAKHKAVQTQFGNGVSVDVLPAVKDGVTLPGDSIPRKHRHAMDGPRHVAWFQREGHAVGAHDTVRLLKSWRDEHHLSALSSFGLEVLTVEALQDNRLGPLDARFEAVLERLASGAIPVMDPVRDSNWVNQLEPREKERVMKAAQESLTALRHGNPSRVFAGPTYPGSVRGLKETPLA